MSSIRMWIILQPRLDKNHLYSDLLTRWWICISISSIGYFMYPYSSGFKTGESLLYILLWQWYFKLQSKADHSLLYNNTLPHIAMHFIPYLHKGSGTSEYIETEYLFCYWGHCNPMSTLYNYVHNTLQTYAHGYISVQDP